VLVPVVGIGWARTFEREVLKTLETDMQNQVELLRTILEKNLDAQGRPDFQVAARALELAAQRTRLRVRLLDRRGAVIADSHLHGAPEGPEPAVPDLLERQIQPQRRHPPHLAATDPGPLSQRPEILAARAGRLGTATRIHQRIERVYLFLAMPVMVQRRVEGIVYVTRSTVPVLVTLHHLRRTLTNVLFVALGITALMSLFLAATISRPLTRLMRAAHRITHGDRSASLALQRSDEIGQLAQAFETLVQQLDGRAQYIAEFAANISHEFKTPLAAIRGAAELLVEGADEDPRARERFLRNILSDTARMDRLVSRVLELSRIEASLEHRRPFDLVPLLEEVAERFALEEVQIQTEQAALPLIGNRPHLESALMALLENAVHFSPPRQQVVLWAHRAPGGPLVVRVTDHGPGISPGNQQKVFTRFFTTEAERGGTGLGLAIVAAVVQAHGGWIELHSELGQGSTFEIQLP
jgi:two-component system, OmpR family, sensor histidine kinase ChvG